MKTYVDKITDKPVIESIIEGSVLSIKKANVFIDLGAFGTGIIYGKEFQNARDIIKKINVGDLIKAKVGSPSLSDALATLTKRRAFSSLLTTFCGALAQPLTQSTLNDNANSQSLDKIPMISL